MEIENLISRSCSSRTITKKFEDLHIAIIKKYYNAVEVSIDYPRKRVEMDIIMDDNDYDPKTVNTNLPTLRLNLLFKNLKEYLKSCLEKDNKSIAFYAGLIKSHTQQDVLLTIV